MIESAAFNVLDYGADRTGVADCTAAFQAAFDAAAAASEAAGGGASSNASVYVPAGAYYIAGTVTCDKRIGFFGDSVNTVIGGTAPGGASPSTCGFRFTAPATTGIAPHIHHLTFFGFQNAPCVEIQTSGAVVENCFFSSSGEGIRLAPTSGGSPASDVVISNIIFDQNLTDILFGSVANVVVSNCISFLAFNAFYFSATGAGNSDIQINNCQFNYSRASSVLCNDVNGNKNIQFADCSFMLNQQFSSFVGFVYIGSSTGSAEFFFKSCNFRNWKDYAVRLLSANIYSFDSCVFDANKTSSAYAQSAASRGIQFVDCSIAPTIKNCEFRNIQQFGLEITTSTVSVVGCYFINTANQITSDLASTVYRSNLVEDDGSVTSNAFKLNTLGSANFVPLSADPATSSPGDVYYNSTVHKLRLKTDVAWVDLN